jgi:lysophospholipase L1-like esterase
LRNSFALVAWALILLIGATAAGLLPEPGPGRDLDAAEPARALAVAELLSKAQIISPPLGAAVQRQLAKAAALRMPGKYAVAFADAAALSGEPLFDPRHRDGVATISAPDGAAKLLRVAMARAGSLFSSRLPLRPAPHREGTALAALEAAAPSANSLSTGVSTYGELEPDIFASHRMTILQLGDSHTAADFFTGRVRERLQQAFGTGGDAYIVPGRPHIGVRSALFESDATDGWTYEALQKSDAHRRFFLSGFNAIARRAGAALSLRSRGGRSYDRVEVAFLKEPGGGKAEVLIDGTPTGSIDLDGTADERATLALRAPATGAPVGFREIAVRALTDAPVTVTGVDVGREGDGVSYLSLGFPGATVQCLQRLTTENLADDLRRMAPDYVVLAFGTNEGFNDNLDIASYVSQYEQIVHRLIEVRPGVRIVMIGPPDAARPAGACHAAGVGPDCTTPAPAQVAAGPGGGQCRFPTPPKLGAVRDAQRKLAERLGAIFWDWSSVMPGPCGAQAWAAATPPLMAHDYVHMTLDGYRLSADRFADFLIPLIEGRPAGAHVVSND